MSGFRKYPPGKFLIPARNSRHRIACLALYRAFLRLAPQVSLPDDLATGWGPGRNPIVIHVRKAFRRNTADISPRIIYPALSAAYRMLEVLHGAASDATSAHHASVTTFLRARLKERKHSHAHYVPPPPKPDAPRPDTIPLLVNVTPAATAANPNPKPEYATPHRPRPQSELGGSGRRQIPKLDMAGDIPFLRLTKPQPRLLSRVLRQKVAKRVERCERTQKMYEDELDDAREEDQWEARVQDLMPKPSPPPRSQRTYAQDLQRFGIVEMFSLLERERVDLVARAAAMRRLIAQEKALAAFEKVQRHMERRGRWEDRMRGAHGEKWREMFPRLREQDERFRAKLQPGA
ncbi:hypothetical protein F4861DRAFT_536831 [Xylaria intraflava]|nr:hypothetical protein F4861DRAFT_536831 [Xylaria intraflava]